MIGTRLSHYVLEEKIGEGGMGIVYKALDTRLLRPVAIKILSSHLVVKEKSLNRFIHEAQAASALNHPNICTVYDIGTAENVHFIVMEFVDGETLREILTRRESPLPMKEVVDIATKVCDALSAAHAKGIIHRDIKPDNIMISQEGFVKVMDFGLAKLKHSAHEPASYSKSQSVIYSKDAVHKTSVSGLLGTVSYMSPEQIERGPTDERSDMFSLGVVLYEMLTGVPPFSGKDNVAVMESILDDDPKPPSKFKNINTNKLDEIILKALAKSPESRYANVALLGSTLKKSQTKRLGKLKAIVLGIVLIFIIALTLDSSLKQFGFVKKGEVTLPLTLQFSPISRSRVSSAPPSFSPDGRFVIYAEKISNENSKTTNFWSKDLWSGKARKILHSKGYSPDWSPDGNRIAYVASDGGICIADTTNGKIVRIADFGSSPRWSPGGKEIVFSTTSVSDVGADNAIFLYNFEDSTLRQISPKNGLNYACPDWSPDGRWIVCTETEGSYRRMWLIEIATGEAQQISDEGIWATDPVWCPQGRDIYFIATNGYRDVWRVAVDLHTGKLTGKPFPITFNMNVVNLDISPDGNKMAFVREETNERLWRVPLTRADSVSLKDTELIMSNITVTRNMEVSPDGTKLVVETYRQGEQMLILKSLADGAEIELRRRVPFAPSWSPDGKWIAFDAGRGNKADIWRIPSSGGQAEKIINYPGADWMPTYSPDGNHICFLSNRGGRFDLWIQELNSGETVQITNTPATESRGFWSHDGQKLAYFQKSKKENVLEIWIYDLNVKASEKLVDISDEEINCIRILVWKYDDSALYYLLANSGPLIEISISRKTVKPVLKFIEEGGKPLCYTFAVFGDSGFFVSYEGVRSSLIAEGLRR